MIEEAVAKWHRIIEGTDPTEVASALDELLDEDAVFYSPVVFTPQRGKAITTMYLLAAKATLASPEGGFRYVKEVLQGDTAVLEFEATLDGKYVNGVDIVTFDQAGKIIEFKVMIRPLQAINLLHEQMRAALEQGSNSPS